MLPLVRLDMHCDVASGCNLKTEHFLHLNRVEREKVTLRNILQYDLEYNGKGQARLCSRGYYGTVRNYFP